MILPEQNIIDEIVKFFGDKLESKENSNRFGYASYKTSWLEENGLNQLSADEAKTARTVKKLQEWILKKFGEKRIKIEANVAENMQLRFIDSDTENTIDASKLMAFDILDLESGCAFEISLADAFAEFFKDVLKALLDSRVKKLYLCMRNHNYSGASKSGYIKVASSPMVKQYISLAKLYKLEIILIDLFPNCNKIIIMNNKKKFISKSQRVRYVVNVLARQHITPQDIIDEYNRIRKQKIVSLKSIKKVRLAVEKT